MSTDYKIWEVRRLEDNQSFKIGDTLLDPEKEGEEFILTSILVDNNWLGGIKLTNGTNAVSVINAIKK